MSVQDQEAIARRARMGVMALLAKVPDVVAREQDVLQEVLAALQVLDPQATPAHGALVISVTVRDGRVLMQFGQPVAWLGFSPTHARQVAAALVSNADLAAGVTYGKEGTEGTEEESAGEQAASEQADRDAGGDAARAGEADGADEGDEGAAGPA